MFVVIGNKLISQQGFANEGLSFQTILSIDMSISRRSRLI
jgi:hypothetical protein